MGDLMLLQSCSFLKLDAKTIKPFVMKNIKGIYKQQIFIEPVDNPIYYRRVISIDTSSLIPRARNATLPKKISLMLDKPTVEVSKALLFEDNLP